MKRYKYATLSNTVKSFSRKKIMVIGDLLLDRIIRGEVTRISPEAPVPVVWQKELKYMPGGACNVASNLTALGAEVSLVGVVGGDDKADILKERLEEKNIITNGIFEYKKRPTILKTRVFAGHNQQVLRIDKEEVEPIPVNISNKIKEYIKQNIKAVDGVIIEDYGKGLITPLLIKETVRMAKRYGKIVSVDPKESHFDYYTNVNVITPNHHEAGRAVGVLLNNDAKLKKAGEALRKKLKAEVVLVTLGEEGMMVFVKGKKPCKIPTTAQEVFDVSGAGDTVIAVYTLSVISGASPIVAAHISNCAAGIVVGKAGVAVVEPAELLGRIKQVIGKGKI